MPMRWIAGGLATLALWPASAAAQQPSGLYSQVLHAYQQTGGSVPACQFSSQQLSAVKGQVDTYGQQYYADFIAAIQTALAGRASGICSKSHRSVSPASAGHLPAGPKLPPSVTSATTSGIPAAMIVLGILAVLGALATGLAAVASRPGAPSEWRHGWAEARHRAGGIWGARAGRRR